LLRLDNYLVEQKLALSRNKAQEIIKKGYVSVNNQVIKKSSYCVVDTDNISIEKHKEYVSRSAFKLAYFLEEIDLNLADKIALDIGSSTGGFTQVLLEHNVLEVHAVDVGHKQLHKILKSDNRVYSYESCDIREFKSNKTFDIIVSDVSFISLENILDDIHRLASNNIILLYKPQFEVGREVKRDKNGVVQDKKAVQNAMTKFENKCQLKNWTLLKKSPSKLTGKEGNLEYCYFFTCIPMQKYI
jgi:23S rRNA (cytidine1920-2'-O)/16S rRNA (cytidine1409-2'-O)-methyltransferase